jgi:hypothetical protein
MISINSKLFYRYSSVLQLHIAVFGKNGWGFNANNGPHAYGLLAT